MELVYEGKTKTVFKLENGNYLLKFKDDATGENGKFDPGANTVGLTIEGLGKSSLALTKFFFTKIESEGIKTHYIDAELANGAMEVLAAEAFGNGLEVICRFKSTGSFMKRYGQYAKEGQDLNGFIEITLKDDEKGDPVISEDALDLLGILSHEKYSELKAMTLKIANIVKEELEKKDLLLYDIKFEFGIKDGKVILIDEISGGNMRAYKDGIRVEPLEIEKIMNS